MALFSACLIDLKLVRNNLRVLTYFQYQTILNKKKKRKKKKSKKYKNYKYKRRKNYKNKNFFYTKSSPKDSRFLNHKTLRRMFRND